MGSFLDRHQVACYVVALAAGALIGSALPAWGEPLEAAINPVLGLLLYATFVSVPMTSISRSFRDGRFLAAVGVVNFLVVPAVVRILTLPITGKPEVYVGLLFVLLCPCIDYVIAFTGLAGGAKERLLAAAPLLLLGQMLLLPVYLSIFIGPQARGLIDPQPFLTAFIGLIVIPLCAAVITQRARATPLIDTAETAMVPLMMATLFVVVASQVASVGQQAEKIAAAVPIMVLFALIMAPAAAVVGRLARLDAPGVKAVAFSGATRNSLVILPLVLALPAGYELAPLVVVTQTLVELVIMVVFVRVIPALIR